MGKTLVLAEKPSVGREIARVLGCRQGGGGSLSGEKYIVTWALGHLVELAQPEQYGEQYKTWSLETLPMLPEKMELKVIPETAKQYAVVKKLLHSPEVDSLVIATDAGREGELVARWILEKAGFHKPIKRLWISSQTDRAIQEGFARLREGREYWNLYQSAVARAEADWLVGLNVTRALTCKFNAQLSAGRVQTPTLYMLVRREEEIKRFVPRDYYRVSADLGPFFVTWQDVKKQSAIFEKEKAEALAQKIQDKEFRVFDVQAKEHATPPPMLYDLTELQRDANRLYQMSPKQTLSVMQRLYENYKALTYPRTDSRYLTEDIVPTLDERLRAVAKGDFAPLVADIRKNRRPIAKACVNNAKVTDHHAIIPTEQGADMMSMSGEEKRIYMLVVRRFLTCFYPPYQFRRIRAELLAEGERFYAAGRVVLDKGWRTVTDAQDEEEEEEQTLPGVQKGDVFICRSVQLKTLQTAPPPRYTEATLLSAMENPAAFIEDKAMKEYIGGGLGTPATRADIIEKLFSAFYMEKKGNSLAPTSKGIQLIGLVPPDLKEPLLTAQWERQLEAISRGEAAKPAFIAGIRDYAAFLVKTVAASDAAYTHDNITRTPCPVCGKMMLEVSSKKGKMLVCQDRECGHRENLSMATNVRCPNCHKRMELFGNGDKKCYVCRCGFREKAEKFHQQSGSGGMSKREVQKYLSRQDEPKGQSALALALQKALAENGGDGEIREEKKGR